MVRLSYWLLWLFVLVIPGPFFGEMRGYALALLLLMTPFVLVTYTFRFFDRLNDWWRKYW